MHRGDTDPRYIISIIIAIIIIITIMNPRNGCREGRGRLDVPRMHFRGKRAVLPPHGAAQIGLQRATSIHVGYGGREHSSPRARRLCDVLTELVLPVYWHF